MAIILFAVFVSTFIAIVSIEARFSFKLIQRLIDHHREFLDGLDVGFPPGFSSQELASMIAMDGWFLSFINPRSLDRRPLKLLLRNRELLAPTEDPRVQKLCAIGIAMRRIRIVYLATIPLLFVILLGFGLY